MDIPEPVLIELKANIARRMTPQPVKLRSDVEVTCFGYEGIEAIKKAFQKAEDLQTESIPISIKLIAPPLYVLVSNTTDKTGGLELLEKALEEIKGSIEGSGGEINIKMKVSFKGF